MKLQVCYHCGKENDCRPYGPGASPVCIDCVMTYPEVDAIAGANFLAQDDAAGAMSRYNVSVISPDGNGPEPLTEELMAHLKALVEAGAEVEIIVAGKPDEL
jgi:hypothetical protein